jgi:hypothetical protein
VRQHRKLKIYPSPIATFSGFNCFSVESCEGAVSLRVATSLKGRQIYGKSNAGNPRRWVDAGSRTEAVRVGVDAATDEKFPMSQKIKFPITFETFAGLSVVASVPELVGVLGRSPRICEKKGQF